MEINMIVRNINFDWRHLGDLIKMIIHGWFSKFLYKMEDFKPRRWCNVWIRKKYGKK